MSGMNFWQEAVCLLKSGFWEETGAVGGSLAKFSVAAVKVFGGSLAALGYRMYKKLSSFSGGEKVLWSKSNLQKKNMITYITWCVINKQ